MTSTERNRLRRQRLASAGNRQISGVTLSPAAAAALTTLTAAGATIDQAVSRALEALAGAEKGVAGGPKRAKSTPSTILE